MLFKNRKAEIFKSINQELLFAYSKLANLLGDTDIYESLAILIRQYERTTKTLQPSDVTYFIDLLNRVDARVLSVAKKEIESNDLDKQPKSILEEDKVSTKEIGFNKGTEKC